MAVATVLANKTVSNENILPGKRDFPSVDLTNKLEETNYSRNPEGPGHSPDNSIGLLDYFHFSGKEHGHGPLP
jgi:hypothetical protein